MDNNADSIVKNWLSSKQKTQAVPQDPADQLVSRWMTKQQGPQATPPDDAFLSVKNAQSDVGDQSYNGLCEAFAEQQSFGRTGMFPTAADAWNSYVDEGKAQGGDVAKAPEGSLIYFNPDGSNNGDGHVGISDGQGNMVSATYSGVQSTPITDWIAQTGQQPLGFVQP